MIFHDSHDIFYRNPLTPVCCNEIVEIKCKYDGNGKVYLRTWDKAEKLYEMNKENDIYTYKLSCPDAACQLWYSFKIVEDDNELIYGNSEDAMGGIGKLYNDFFHSYLIVVYDNEFKTPNYIHKGNMYQIFPDRFAKGNYKVKNHLPDRKIMEWYSDPLLEVDPKNGDNYAHDFFMGNLEGIIDKLDYLYDLGIRIIYLNPIFKAGTNHRYDTGDYSMIDPYLGTIEIFNKLCKEAQKRDMKIILDGVFSHTGHDSKYFNALSNYDSIGAYQDENSKYSDWFKFTEFPEKYAAWWGIYTLPEINKNSESYKKYMLDPSNGIVAKWLKEGSSGWRLDVADELPMEFIRGIRKSAKNNLESSIIIGEVWEDASNKVSYGDTRCYCLGDTLDSVMNYPLRTNTLDFLNNKINAFQLKRFLCHQKEVYPKPFYYSLMNLLSSHDRARAINVLSGHEHINEDRKYCQSVKLTVEEYTAASKKLLAGIALLIALPGCPCIYYGDEVGMQGTSDPWNRRPYPWGYEDKSLQENIKKLLNFRLANEVLQNGDITIKATDENTIVIERFFNDNKDVFGNDTSTKRIVFTLNKMTGDFSFSND